MDYSRLVRLRTAIGATESLAKKALFRHRYSRALREAGRQKEAVWQGRLALIERCLSFGKGTESLRQRFWLALAFSGFRTLRFARAVAHLSYHLAAILDPHR